MRSRGATRNDVSTVLTVEFANDEAVPWVDAENAQCPDIGTEPDDSADRDCEWATESRSDEDEHSDHDKPADTCTCGEQTADTSSDQRVATDGAGVANVDENGELGDLEFTEPATDVSQDIYEDSPR